MAETLSLDGYARLVSELGDERRVTSIALARHIENLMHLQEEARKLNIGRQITEVSSLLPHFLFEHGMREGTDRDKLEVTIRELSVTEADDSDKLISAVAP